MKRLSMFFTDAGRSRVVQGVAAATFGISGILCIVCAIIGHQHHSTEDPMYWIGGYAAGGLVCKRIHQLVIRPLLLRVI